jgi:hypothetical protein
MNMSYVLTIIIAVITLINIFASVRVMKSSEYEPIQKIGQHALVWFLPIIGAFLIHHFSTENRIKSGFAAGHFVESGHGDFDRNNSAAENFSASEGDGSD